MKKLATFDTIQALPHQDQQRDGFERRSQRVGQRQSAMGHPADLSEKGGESKTEDHVQAHGDDAHDDGGLGVMQGVKGPR